MKKYRYKSRGMEAYLAEGNRTLVFNAFSRTVQITSSAVHPQVPEVERVEVTLLSKVALRKTYGAAGWKKIFIPHEARVVYRYAEESLKLQRKAESAGRKLRRRLHLDR